VLIEKDVIHGPVFCIWLLADAPPPPAGSTAMIRFEARDHGVRLLRLDRPERRNAMDRAMIDALLAALRAGAEDPTVAAMVIAGAGGHFSAGADLAEMRQLAADPDAPVLDEIRALADYQISQVDLAFATGTVLGATKVSWEPVDKPGPNTTTWYKQAMPNELNDAVETDTPQSTPPAQPQ
jgi:hypothetical protein